MSEILPVHPAAFQAPDEAQTSTHAAEECMLGHCIKPEPLLYLPPPLTLL